MINKVLCIDDDQITLILCDLVLKKSGFSDDVKSVFNGREGIEWFSNHFKIKAPIEDAPQIIFLDLNMPIMNGWDFLQEYEMKYADRLPDTKVVIVSSTVNPEDFSRANKHSLVIDFIHKPMTIDGLTELMENEHLHDFFHSV